MKSDHEWTRGITNGSPLGIDGLALGVGDWGWIERGRRRAMQAVRESLLVLAFRKFSYPLIFLPSLPHWWLPGPVFLMASPRVGQAELR